LLFRSSPLTTRFHPVVFFFQAEDGIRDFHVTGVQTCALPISGGGGHEHVLRHDAGLGQALTQPGGLTSAVQREGAAVVAEARARLLGLRVPDHDERGHGAYCPIACTPPSTWIISPVVAGNQSLSSAVTARAAGSTLSESQPSGARSAHLPSIWSKPGMCLAAVVLSGPADTTLQRMPCGPRSRAR